MRRQNNSPRLSVVDAEIIISWFQKGATGARVDRRTKERFPRIGPFTLRYAVSQGFELD